MTEAMASRGSLGRFFQNGLDGIEHRWRRALAPQPADDPTLMRLVDRSLLVRAVDLVVCRMGDLYERSWTARRGTEAIESWHRLARTMQRRALATVLLASVGVHLLLVAWQGTPPGWLWLLLPAVEAAVGGVLAASGAGPPRASES